MTGAVEVGSHQHRHATRFFWGWLVSATVVSLVGNVAHAWLTAPVPTRWLAALVAVVPPAVLLAAVHGIAALVGAGVRGAVYRLAVAAAGALAAGAFALSFVALRDLVVMAGVAPGLAVVFPLVIDLAVCVATVALVAVGDRPTPRPVTATVSPPPRTPTSPSSPVPQTPRVVAAPGAPVVVSGGVRERPVIGSPVPADATADVARRAAVLVARKATRQPVETVEAILTAHGQGVALNRIAANLGVHHSAVRRVLDADSRSAPMVAV